MTKSDNDKTLRNTQLTKPLSKRLPAKNPIWGPSPKNINPLKLETDKQPWYQLPKDQSE